jgi:hypothetical protein
MLSKVYGLAGGWQGVSQQVADARVVCDSNWDTGARVASRGRGQTSASLHYAAFDLSQHWDLRPRPGSRKLVLFPAEDVWKEVGSLLQNGDHRGRLQKCGQRQL